MAKFERLYKVFSKIKTPRCPTVIDIFFKRSESKTCDYILKGSELVGGMNVSSSKLYTNIKNFL